MLQPRQYQIEAVRAVYDGMRAGMDPTVSLPTGSGKSLVMAMMIRDFVEKWDGRVLLLAHVKELLQQNARTVLRHWGEADIGIYSAGLGRRDSEHSIIVAGIQSVYRRGPELCGDRPFNVVVVDERHRVPFRGEGMYLSLLDDLRLVNPRVRMVGLTATPFRMDGGMVNNIVYEANVRELIDQGYLCPLRSKSPRQQLNTSDIRQHAGDFSARDMNQKFSRQASGPVREMINLCDQENRSCVAVFTTGIQHAEAVAQVLRQRNERVECVHSKTPKKQREEALRKMEQREIRWLVNPTLLTEGWDCPRLDAVVSMRPTLSAGLWVQTVGRGLRVHEEKQDCLILDYGGNIDRHGPIDTIRPVVKSTTAGGSKSQTPPSSSVSTKKCLQCDEWVPMHVPVCPTCGWEFPSRLQKSASTSPVISNGQGAIIIQHDVTEVRYHEHKSWSSGRMSMRVEYWNNGFEVAREWICVEHDGLPRSKAVAWWSERAIDSDSRCPRSVKLAVSLARGGRLKTPKTVTTKKVKQAKWSVLVNYEY